MHMLEYNEMMSILFFSQHLTLSYQPSAQLLQKTFDRMK